MAHDSALPNQILKTSAKKKKKEKKKKKTETWYIFFQF